MRTRLAFGEIAAAVVWSSAADAYVRTRTTSGTPIAWTSGCLQLHVDTTPNPLLSTDREKAALDAALDAWNAADQTCTAFVLYRSDDASDARVAFDGKSMVLWRLPRFCDQAANEEDEACLSPDATATTTVFYHDNPGAPDDGHIVEADMEINAVHFTFDDRGGKGDIDLQSVFAHELGHCIGLDHTCAVNHGAAPLLDDHGHPVPFCFPVDALPASVTSATMYNFIVPGETDKRGPSADEKRAACGIYSTYAGSCSGENGGASCSVGSLGTASAGGLVAASIVGLVVVLARRRRRS